MFLDSNRLQLLHEVRGQARLPLQQITTLLCCTEQKGPRTLVSFSYTLSILPLMKA